MHGVRSRGRVTSVLVSLVTEVQVWYSVESQRLCMREDVGDQDCAHQSSIGGCARAPASWSASATTATVLELATTPLVEASTSSSIAVSTISTWLRSARLDVDCLSRDLVWVGGSGSLITFRSGILDKGTILGLVSYRR